MRPALIPIPAFCETYLTILDDVALIESSESSVSISTQLENCLWLVLTPAITGVGSDIWCVEIAS